MSGRLVRVIKLVWHEIPVGEDGIFLAIGEVYRIRSKICCLTFAY